MSRVGQKPIAIPSGINVEITNKLIKASGKNGSLEMILSSDVEVSKEGDSIVVKPKNDSKRASAMWGTTRNQIANVIKGVDTGFTVNLELNGVGYRGAVQGKDLVLQLGFSHEVKYAIPEGIKVETPKPTSVQISGADRQKVGQIASEIRAYRKPEPYKGKGIKYEGEYIRRKEGKKK